MAQALHMLEVHYELRTVYPVHRVLALRAQERIQLRSLHELLQRHANLDLLQPKPVHPVEPLAVADARVVQHLEVLVVNPGVPGDRLQHLQQAAVSQALHDEDPVAAVEHAEAGEDVEGLVVPQLVLREHVGGKDAPVRVHVQHLPVPVLHGVDDGLDGLEVLLLDHEHHAAVALEPVADLGPPELLGELQHGLGVQLVADRLSQALVVLVCVGARAPPGPGHLLAAGKLKLRAARAHRAALRLGLPDVALPVLLLDGAPLLVLLPAVLALDLGAQRDRHCELCLDGAYRAGVGGLRLGLSRGDVGVELGRRLQLVHARPGLHVLDALRVKQPLGSEWVRHHLRAAHLLVAPRRHHVRAERHLHRRVVQQAAQQEVGLAVGILLAHPIVAEALQRLLELVVRTLRRGRVTARLRLCLRRGRLGRRDVDRPVVDLDVEALVHEPFADHVHREEAEQPDDGLVEADDLVVGLAPGAHPVELSREARRGLAKLRVHVHEDVLALLGDP
mmetsp:Transcript_4164/g.12114  ORF Transcript_4164/g.12114 Transcript_4164/m.12114 type:complete len:505 (+) Transcript_4164:1696-3210(+)